VSWLYPDEEKIRQALSLQIKLFSNVLFRLEFAPRSPPVGRDEIGEKS
jgi:hypothetical protein